MNNKITSILIAVCLFQIVLANPCAICTYSTDGTDATTCNPCPQNTCTPAAGTKGNDNTVCIAQLCPQGTSSATGFDTDGKGAGCTSCLAGNYSGVGSKTCTPCPAGTYSSADKSASCQHCDIGTYSTPGSVKCSITTKQCPAGYSGLNAGYDTDGNGAGCTKCEINNWSNQGASQCSPCINNRTSPAGSTSVTACACPQGTTGPNDGISLCKPSSSSSNILQIALVFISLIVFF
ncbi:hypothetical protein TTHERM_01125110 (macronuclear) [Tetrahymena thermophila SB210]|uniref:Tyrosine-protein kinase ephrin type A/B receptor-like domain-containing protein n=1 Tax=Tetrahymena thermophila (strain SB210) TaxID=312017 RepID=Q22B32_TETTS|nr:hypothetical protein TTHERM_01125110 [Tetrahymena thermophila SB210]EAR82476.1 hypothetical protein TTHERM_01125110 [Tetrahymena thermophila SB210]|eukprot:XP_001030139.1 hypothetical protein TTHERM_01125110 [Tetrahymena thermophila SB210]